MSDIPPPADAVAAAYLEEVTNKILDLETFKPCGDLELKFYITASTHAGDHKTDYLSSLAEADDSGGKAGLLFEGLSKLQTSLLSEDSLTRLHTTRGLYIGGDAASPTDRLNSNTKWQYMQQPHFVLKELSEGENSIRLDMLNTRVVPLESLSFAKELTPQQIAGYLARVATTYDEGYSPDEIYKQYHPDGRINGLEKNDVLNILSNALTVRIRPADPEGREVYEAQESRVTLVFTDNDEVNQYLARYARSLAPDASLAVNNKGLSVDLSKVSGITLDLPTNPVDFTNGLRVSAVLRPQRVAEATIE